jgi:hypothetical protein
MIISNILDFTIRTGAERLKTQGFQKIAPLSFGSFFIPTQAIVPQQINPIPI